MGIDVGKSNSDEIAFDAEDGTLMNLHSELISDFDSNTPNFRPTELYNESWMLKLVLNQALTLPEGDFPLSFLPHSTWFSAGLLPTAFRPRYRGDSLGESRTHADGVIGHIQIGRLGKADLELKRDARQFTVIEAKIRAGLRPGTSNAKYFDQAVRNVACVAEAIARARISPSSLQRLDFVVLAPDSSIEKGAFSKEMDSKSIKSKITRRVGEYDGELDDWFTSYFEPTFDCINLHVVSWESALDWIGAHRSDAYLKLHDYYELCLQFN